MSADQLREAEEYVRRMLRRDMAIEPTEIEITRITRSLLAAGAFAPDAGEFQLKTPVSVDSEPLEATKTDLLITNHPPSRS